MATFKYIYRKRVIQTIPAGKVTKNPAEKNILIPNGLSAPKESPAGQGLRGENLHKGFIGHIQAVTVTTHKANLSVVGITLKYYNAFLLELLRCLGACRSSGISGC